MKSRLYSEHGCVYELSVRLRDGCSESSQGRYVTVFHSDSGEDRYESFGLQPVVDAYSGEPICLDLLSTDPDGDKASFIIGPYTSPVLTLSLQAGKEESEGSLLFYSCCSHRSSLGYCTADLERASKSGGCMEVELIEEDVEYTEEGATVLLVSARQMTMQAAPGHFGILLCRAWNLPDLLSLTLIDPKVVVQIEVDGEVVVAMESSVIDNALAPIWDEMVQFPHPDSWDVDATTVTFIITDTDLTVGPVQTDRICGMVSMPLSQLLERPAMKALVCDRNGNPVLHSSIPHMPCELAVAPVVASFPSGWPKPVPQPSWSYSTYPKHIFMLTRGTRGDVQPFVALARGMAEQFGWLVTICTELRWRDFIKEKSNVSRGRIRFRPSGGDTEARMEKGLAPLLLSRGEEMIQMLMMANSEKEFFKSATVFLHHIEEMENEPKPVDLLICAFTVLSVCAAIAEHLHKPMAGFILQPSAIPSTDPDWLAIHGVDTCGGFGITDWFHRTFFTSHQSLFLMKGAFEENPLSKYNIHHIREWLGLETAEEWQMFEERNIPLVVPMRGNTFDRPSDWWDGIQFTDFIFLRSAGPKGTSTSLGEPIDSFISEAKQANAKLAVMTFSSMPVVRSTMLKSATCMVDECEYDLRLIYVGQAASDSVSASLEELAETLTDQGRFLEVPRADFGKLFKHMDFFVIHGGLGTTVEALRLRKPVAVTGPLLLDQRFWGQVVYDKGVGPEMVEIQNFNKICVEFANDALDPDDPKGYQANAMEDDWGSEADDGVRENIEAFARILQEGRGYIFNAKGGKAVC